MRSSDWRAAALASVGLLLAGCATTQPAAFPLGTHRHPAKPATAAVQWFRGERPQRAYEPVAHLNVHFEKTFLIPTAFSEARPPLETLARQQGADAIMDVVETKSRLNETFIYNVSATAIVFTD